MGCSMCKSSSADKEKTAAQRKAAWARLKQRLPTKRTPEDKQRRIDLFKKMDTNNSGRLTCDEVYTGCVHELGLDEFTNRLRDVVKRAFNKAKALGTTEAGQGSEDYVEFLEFRLMLCYIYDYCELTVMFDELDESGNMLLTKKEFEKAVPKIEEWGLKIDDPEATFKEVDADGSGQVTFDEFANWASAKKLDISGDPDA